MANYYAIEGKLEDFDGWGGPSRPLGIVEGELRAEAIAGWLALNCPGIFDVLTDEVSHVGEPLVRSEIDTALSGALGAQALEAAKLIRALDAQLPGDVHLPGCTDEKKPKPSVMNAPNSASSECEREGDFPEGDEPSVKIGKQFAGGFESGPPPPEAIPTNPPAGADGKAAYPAPAHYARDKWIYENIECNSFPGLQLELKKVAKAERYAVISSRQGMKKAADRYAAYHSLPIRRFLDKRNGNS